MNKLKQRERDIFLIEKYMKSCFVHSYKFLTIGWQNQIEIINEV